MNPYYRSHSSKTTLTRTYLYFLLRVSHRHSSAACNRGVQKQTSTNASSVNIYHIMTMKDTVVSFLSFQLRVKPFLLRKSCLLSLYLSSSSLIAYFQEPLRGNYIRSRNLWLSLKFCSLNLISKTSYPLDYLS